MSSDDNSLGDPIEIKVNYAVKQNKLSEREITWHYTIAPYGVSFIR